MTTPNSVLSSATLKRNLQAQLEAHQQVNQVLQQLRQSVMVGKTDQVKESNQQLVQLGQTMARLEQERQQLLHKAGYTTFPLRQLIKTLPASEQQSLDELRQKLNKTIREVRQEQHDTQSALRHSIQWVNQTVATIAQKLQPEPTSYGPAIGRSAKSSGMAKASPGASLPTSQSPLHRPLPGASAAYEAQLPPPAGDTLVRSAETSIIERTA